MLEFVFARSHDVRDVRFDVCGRTSCFHVGGAWRLLFAVKIRCLWSTFNKIQSSYVTFSERHVHNVSHMGRPFLHCIIFMTNRLVRGIEGGK